MLQVSDTQPAVSDSELRELLGEFYGLVREDAVLGPIFERAIDDWPAHLERLTAFWSSVMRGSGAYKGNPFAAHRRHLDEIDPGMFDRWLGIWRATTSRRFPPEIAAIFHLKADRIGESLKAALFFRPELTQTSPANPTSKSG
ncbi:group III truncated hemoglobin [Aurantimonas sp. A3-2-R12]|uniref:group III truncated hemoglobin n=1 Tax=Aurantimonas sp. A3-2-R12 TaxID=3114362 RepID=UPI002E18EBD0|nr:group III truncated hemoglobin [Aurantimonas sp. A3-2-R12]